MIKKNRNTLLLLLIKKSYLSYMQNSYCHCCANINNNNKNKTFETNILFCGFFVMINEKKVYNFFHHNLYIWKKCTRVHGHNNKILPFQWWLMTKILPFMIFNTICMYIAHRRA